MKTLKLFLIFSAVALFSLGSGIALATPARVLIVRHGEKPSDDENHLSARGRARAEALGQIFTDGKNERRLGVPDFIFAAAPKHADSSVRPYQTALPLAKALRLKINLDYTKDETRELARELLEAPEYDGKTILISWVHKEIPALAEEMGAGEVPAKWDGGSYDRIWKISFPQGRAGDLIDLPQAALPGDSKT